MTPHTLSGLAAGGILHLAASAAPTRSQARRARDRRRRGRRVLEAAAISAALGTLAWPASAYFTTGGSGSAMQGAADLLPLTILSETTGSPSASLMPGGSGELLVRVTNPNAQSVTIVSVVQGGGVAVSHATGCTADPAWPGSLGNSGVSVASSTGLSIPVAAGATTLVHLPAAAVMSTGSAAGCQSATFQVPVTVAVRQ